MPRYFYRRLFHSILLLFVCTTSAASKELLIAVAANFAQPAKEISSAFEKNTGTHVKLSIGSTGKLFAQIVNNLPVSIFLAADSARPDKLVQQGLAVKESRFVYARGRLALWNPAAADQWDQAAAIAALKAGKFRKLAMANPKLAPYGLAAEQTLRHLGLYDGLESKLVFGENIGQTHTLIASGNAELGFVALSSLKAMQGRASGAYWAVQQEYYSPVDQVAVLLTASHANEAARRFLDYLKSDTARAVIESYGYDFEK